MYDQILIPYDGSDEAKKGAKHGIELAAALGSTVHGLYVIDLPGAPRALAIRDDEEQMRKEYKQYGEQVLAELTELGEEFDVEVVSEMRTGTPSEEIVDYAKDESMDAIVMGSAYRGKIGGLLGGTMDKVVRSATVPVVSQRMRMEEI